MPYNFDPQLAPFAVDLLPEHDLHDVVTSREVLKEFFSSMPNGFPDTVVVRDREIPGPAGPVRVRIYAPRERAEETAPAMVFIHGGGFIVGQIEMGDALLSPWPRAGRGRCPSTTGSRPSTRSRPASRTATPRCAWLHDARRRARRRPGAHRGRRPERRRRPDRRDRRCSRATAAARALLPVPRHPRARPPARDHEHAHVRRHADVAPRQRRAQLAAATSAADRRRGVALRVAGAGRPISPACRPRTSRRWSSTRCATRASSTRSRLLEAGVPVELHAVPRHVPRLRLGPRRPGLPAHAGRTPVRAPPRLPPHPGRSTGERLNNP